MSAYFKFEWQQFITNKKNIALLIIALSASLYYVLIIGPRYEPVEVVNQAELTAKNSDRRQFVDDYDPTTDRTGYLGMAAQMFTDLLKIDEPRLKALETNDWETYAKLTAENYDLLNQLINPGTEGLLNYNRKYYEYGRPASYSGMEARYGYFMTARRYEGYVANANQINQNILEERTGIQHLGRLFSTALPYFLLILGIFLMIDSLSKDFKHPTILFGFPLSTTKKLILKYLVCLLGFLGIMLLAFALIYFGMSFQFGFGQLDLALAVNQQSPGVIKYIPLWLYLLQNLALILLHLSLLYWLFALVTLITKVELLNLVLGISYLFAERLYYGRGKGYFIDFSYLPFSYIRTGAVLSGYDNFYYHSQEFLYNFRHGLISLSLNLLIMMLLTILWTKRRRFRSL